MKKLIDLFIEKVITKINEYYLCFYEEAPSNVTFPYLVVPTISVTPLDMGYSAIFDIEIYINELSSVSTETIIDTLRDNLAGYRYKDNKIGFHLGFENHMLVRSNEQDLSIRKITFEARIF